MPLWLFYYGGAVVLLVSFVALGALWPKPRLDAAAAAGRPLPPALQRVLLSRPLRVVLGAATGFLLLLVFATAAFGDVSPNDNLAPTFVYVVFWLGLVPLVVLLGNVWSVLNPWRAFADLFVWAAARLGWDPRPLLPYPERLGRRPAAALLFAFAALELAYPEPANPTVLAIAAILYSYVTWVGMAVYGRRAWLENGEAFSVYFGLLARLAPFAARDGESGRELVVRAPLAGLAGRDPRPGTLAFVAVMLGSTSFDGFTRSPFWRDLHAGVAAGRAPGLGADLLLTAAGLVGLGVFVALVAGSYLAAVASARAVAREGRSLAADFLLSLVPIALAYAVAHYFSLLVLQGQFAIPLASDPFGYGWDLFGTADHRPRLDLLSPETTWYVQVGALVVGHIASLVVAHDRAVALLRSPKLALRAQYALLTLMVLYTVAGLWLLSRG